jgi:hypothetical protein
VHIQQNLASAWTSYILDAIHKISGIDHKHVVKIDKSRKMRDRLADQERKCGASMTSQYRRPLNYPEIHTPIVRA